jgi:WD40 repeat protein
MRSCLVILGIIGMSSATVREIEPATIKGLGGWVGAVAFSPDGRSLAIGTGDGSIGIWDAARRERIMRSPGHTDAVAALTWSSDGHTLVSGGHDHLAFLHGLNLEKKEAEKSQILRGHTGAVMTVALSPDGTQVFTGSIDGTIRMWDAKTAALTKVVAAHTSWVNGLALDSSVRMLASAGSDNTLRLWRLPDWDSRGSFSVKDGEIRAVALSPDHKLVAAGIRYGGLRVWDLESKKEVASMPAHKGETWAVAFTPDGKFLASAGGDWNQPGEVRLWDTAKWKERATLRHSGEVLCLSISPDGRFLAAGSWDRAVRIWELARVTQDSEK